MMHVKLYLESPAAMAKLAEAAALEAEYRQNRDKAFLARHPDASKLYVGDFGTVAQKMGGALSPVEPSFVENLTDDEPVAEDTPKPKRGRPAKAAKPEPEPEAPPAPKKAAAPTPAPAADDAEDLPFGGDVGKATEAYHSKFGIVPLKTLLKYRHHVNRGSELKPEKQAAYLRDVQTALTGGVPWSIEDAIESPDDTDVE